MRFARTKFARATCTLVEIVIVIAIIALLTASALPSFLRARKRSQTAHIPNDLRLTKATADTCTIGESNKTRDPVGA
jgi:Tfp pilus assembly protein FimT